MTTAPPALETPPSEGPARNSALGPSPPPPPPGREAEPPRRCLRAGPRRHREGTGRRGRGHRPPRRSPRPPRRPQRRAVADCSPAAPCPAETALPSPRRRPRPPAGGRLPALEVRLEGGQVGVPLQQLRQLRRLRRLRAGGGRHLARRGIRAVPRRRYIHPGRGAEAGEAPPASHCPAPPPGRGSPPGPGGGRLRRPSPPAVPAAWGTLRCASPHPPQIPPAAPGAAVSGLWVP